MTVITNNESETLNLGISLGRSLRSGGVIAFFGGLGVGKTHLITGIAKGIGYDGETYSPTFAIVNEYLGGRIPMYHFDMYRINSWEDLYSTGYFDYIDSGGLLAVEWSENIIAAIPDDAIKITIKRLDGDRREITLEGVDDNENLGY